MSEYDSCVRGPLKIKGDSNIKKKSKKKDKKKLLEQVSKMVETTETEGGKPQNQFELTKAEIAFKKQQEKMQEERIKKMASMSHKQRVEEFNKHLDSLTEHFDIPKVSWTK
ncbi:hypothetical protein RUM43_006737 [Polyplax serrata]|uniref:FAM32A n=1 Tax=Polyplax serrata TaxID=468196 RepID=A0AAN8P4K3_POLSC